MDQASRQCGHLLWIVAAESSQPPLVSLLTQLGHHVDYYCLAALASSAEVAQHCVDRTLADGEADDFARVVAAVQTLHPDLIILMAMDEATTAMMDVLCRHLRQGGISIPILFAFANEQPGQRVAAFAAGAVDYLTAPFLLAELSARIDPHLALTQLRQQFQTQSQHLQKEMADRQRVEEVLWENQRVLSTLMNNLPGLAYRCINDNQWTMCFVSQGCYDLTGYRPEELVNNQVASYRKLVHPDDQKRMWREVQAAITDNRPFQLVYRITTARHEQKWVWEQGEGIFSPTGELLAMEGFITDISDRKQAEEAMRLSEEKFSKAFRASPNPITIATLDEGRLVEVNEAFLAVTGYHRDNLLGYTQSALGLFRSPELAQRLKKLLREEGVVRNLEMELLTKAREVKTILVSAEVIQVGRVPCVLSVLSDITDRKQAEARQAQILIELKRAKAATEQAAQAKMNFLAVMSHEIRNPINGILGMTQLLSDTELTTQQQRYVKSIQVSSETLLTVVNDSLDFSKIEAGQLQLENRPLSLQSCLEDVCELMRPKATEKQIYLYYQVDDRLPRFILGDITRLRQILLNLVSNAIKFTSQGGVSIRVIAVSGDNPAGTSLPSLNLQFSVQDTGIGIPADKLDRLFKPFSQVDASTTRKYGGTGLGLVICSQIVRLMRGRIWVESVLGEGSTFYFTLPLHPATIAEVRAASEPEVSLQPKKQPDATLGQRKPLQILLADDNLINQELALAMLAKLGYSADAVSNGQEAIAAITAKHYDLVFMDVQMPEMDGLQATQIITQRWSGPERPKIIAMTAGVTQQDRDRCRAAGMDDYINKPVLIEAVQQVLEKWGTGQPMATAAVTRLAGDGLVLDEEVIHRLRSINPTLPQRMMRIFLEEEGPPLLQQLQAAMRQRNYDVMRRLAHSLKGTSFSLGANAMGNLCRQIENQSHRSDPSDIDRLGQELDQIYQQTQAALQRSINPEV